MDTTTRQSIAAQGKRRPKTAGRLSRRIAMTTATAALAITVGLMGSPLAYAATDQTEAEPNELQQRIEESATAYDEATARVQELQAQIEENEAKIAEIQEKLPEYEQRAQDALVSMYKAQSQAPNLVSMILQSESLSDFVTNITYMNTIHGKNVEELNNLTQMQDELEAAQAELESDKAEAEEQQKNAESALAEAQAAREQAQREAQEKAAEEAAAAEEEQASEDSGSDSTSSGGETVAPPSNDGADWSSDEEAFVAEWAPRIDAYLAGSPLAGQGETFARAAWTYGVDPRWSPAISNTESSKGRYCFKSHNAWGWGSYSYSSWEEAIYSHVRGLARGYGYTISVEAAKKYCPPNWEHWYNATLAEMGKI